MVVTLRDVCACFELDHWSCMVTEECCKTLRPPPIQSPLIIVYLDPPPQTKTVVNNESSEIIQILNSAFNDVEGVGNPGLDLAPITDQERTWANEVDGWMYDEVCNGVYKSGFATTQEAYDRAVVSLFEHLDK